MYQSIILLLALSSARLVHGQAFNPDSFDELIVNTTSGSIHGFVGADLPNVRQFLGVPYAQPPVGSLRWQPPKTLQTRREILALQRPPTCMQKLLPGAVYDGPYIDFVTDETQSEDCLYVSVYAPKQEHIKHALPVLVYFPGGGYVSGGSDAPYERPGPWIERSRSHIVVTVNYRLNIFGFPNAAGGTQNYGFLDQRSSVEWVRDNIATFGGDAKRISIWGQSAGAASVSYYPYIWVDDPIVVGLVSHSGVGHSVTSEDYSHSNFSAIANLVKCYRFQPKEELECMRKVEPVLLSQAISEYTATTGFLPVADNITVYGDMHDRISRDLVAKIPMIAGDNSNEGASLIPIPPDGTLSVGPEWEQIGFDNFNCPDAQEMNNRADNGHTTYRYYYDGNFTNISPLPWIGATHSAELPMVFGTHELNGNSTELEKRVSETMQDLWLAFITDPSKDPVYGDFTWPKYHPSTQSTLVVAANDSVTYLADRMLIEGRCKA